MVPAANTKPQKRSSSLMAEVPFAPNRRWRPRCGWLVHCGMIKSLFCPPNARTTAGWFDSTRRPVNGATILQPSNLRYRIKSRVFMVKLRLFGHREPRSGGPAWLPARRVLKKVSTACTIAPAVRPCQACDVSCLRSSALDT